MKIKLDKPLDFSTKSNSANNVSIFGKNTNNGDKQEKNIYTNNVDSKNNVKADEISKTTRVDRVEQTEKIEKTEKTTGDYFSVLKQRNDKHLQLRKELIQKTNLENTAKSDVNREKNKKDIVERISSSTDNANRVRKEFTENRDKITTKIVEQNDDNIKIQAELRENKRKLLAEIQKTTQNKTEIQSELKKNKLELTNKSSEKNSDRTSVVEIFKNSKDTSLLDERKASLLNNVVENSNEDLAIKQKLSQYKRELASATTKRDMIEEQTDSNSNELKNIELKVDKPSNDNSNLEKVRDLIKEQTVEKKLTEMLINNIDTNNDDFADEVKLTKIKNSASVDKLASLSKLQLDTNFKLQKSTKIKLNTTFTSNVVKNSKPKAIVSDLSSQIPIYDNYQAPNLTAFDISLLNDTPNVVNVSSTLDSDSSTKIATNSLDSEKQALLSKILNNTDETSEIQQKLRDYQAQVRKINSEINSLTEQSRSTSLLSYKNSSEDDKVDSKEEQFKYASEDEVTQEDVLLYQMESILESESDLNEVEVMFSTQEELNSAIKILATEIKQEELLAKIEEQEQAIARNKILEKRESLIQLAQQNNELLRTLNERLSIITKKVTKSVIYAPTIITRKNKMVA